MLKATDQKQKSGKQRTEINQSKTEALKSISIFCFRPRKGRGGWHKRDFTALVFFYKSNNAAFGGHVLRPKSKSCRL